jgi:hypothetical protein
MIRLVVRDVFRRRPRFALPLRSVLPVLGCLAMIFFRPQFFASAESQMDDLAQPIEGRSMRATSSFRAKIGGKTKIYKDKKTGKEVQRLVYDPEANFLSDPSTEMSNCDNFTIESGKKHVLLEADGPGMVTRLYMSFLPPEPQNWAPQGAANHQEMLLQIYYDGNPRPGVEAPVGDFFANCFGKRSEVISIPVLVEDADAYSCFWRMPFRKSIKIEILNQSEKQLRLLYYNIDWIKKDSLPEDAPYFYAQYRQEYPVEQGKDYVVLDTKGKGHYVGTVLAVRTRSPDWFGEGEERIYIDGEEQPSIQGTGTEEYFLSGWGLKKFSTPYSGVSYFDQCGIVGGHTAAYRWHIQDPLVFNTGIKVTFEHYGWITEDENPQGLRNSWNERQDDYSSVAFWYQTGIPTFTARAPSARQRRLPSLERVTVAAKDFTDPKYHGKGRADVQPIGWLHPEGPQMLYQPKQAEGAWVEIPFKVEKKEPLRLLINCTRAPDFGKYQASLNGVPLGKPLDLYNDKIDLWEFHLLDFWPDPGDYTLRLECVGKNFHSEGYFLGLESVRLRERRPRVMQYGRDKDKDWRKHIFVYGKDVDEQH